MLRILFGEQPGEADGTLAEANAEMRRFVSLMTKRILSGEDVSLKLRTYEVWTLGLIASLDELEQSRYAARRFASRITKSSLGEMSEDERLDYSRYVFFDKNALIRVFAVLDKLGTLMNDLFQLGTERTKARFSYFTVLRNMRHRRLHPALSEVLGALKDEHREALDYLRKRRNTEVHHMNTEMLDDLVQMQRAYGQEIQLEDVQAHLRKLDEAFEMVTETLRLSFAYGYRHMKRRG